jgi:SUMO ligase MMS21 Smc5/6 complex component
MTSRQKYVKSEVYAAFKQSIYEVQHPNEAMPPVVEFLPREEGDNSDDDEDDIQVGGVLQDINCPITLTPLVDPQTSLVCQHTFSAAAIQQVLGPNRFTKKKCPASGCNQMICLNDLKPNKELERRVKAYQRRAQRREEDHDAEEIVE